MPAAALDLERLGIIAGGGSLPRILLECCDRRGIEAFVVGFEGQTDPLLVKDRNHLWTRLGAAGKMIRSLREHGIRDLVMIGSVRRPSFAEIRPDMKGAEILARIGLGKHGDDGLLGGLRKCLEEEGFRLHGFHEFAPEMLTAEGPLGVCSPSAEDWTDIERGMEVARQLGLLDVGQSVIVQEGIVLGVEGAEGTDELIRRCAPLKRKGRGGVLVKMCKPQQDRALDMPVIGPETLRSAVECGLDGIALEAGQTLVTGAEEVAKIADKHKMFVVGVIGKPE